MSKPRKESASSSSSLRRKANTDAQFSHKHKNSVGSTTAIGVGSMNVQNQIQTRAFGKDLTNMPHHTQFGSTKPVSNKGQIPHPQLASKYASYPKKIMPNANLSSKASASSSFHGNMPNGLKTGPQSRTGYYNSRQSTRLQSRAGSGARKPTLYESKAVSTERSRRQSLGSGTSGSGSIKKRKKVNKDSSKQPSVQYRPFSQFNERAESLNR